MTARVCTDLPLWFHAGCGINQHQVEHNPFSPACSLVCWIALPQSSPSCAQAEQLPAAHLAQHCWPNRQLWAAHLQQLSCPKHKSHLSCALWPKPKFKEPTAVLSTSTEVWLRWGIGCHLYKDKDFAFLVFSLEDSIENQLTDQTKTHKSLLKFIFIVEDYISKSPKS